MAAITDALVKTGNAAIAVSGTAVQVSDEFGTIYGVTIAAPDSNTATIYLGTLGVTNTAGGGGNGYNLEPGNSISLPINDLSVLFINGTAGDIVTYNVLSMFASTPDPVYEFVLYEGDFVTYEGDFVIL